VEKRSARRFQARIQPERVVDSTGLEAALKDKELRIIDVRAGERYRGEVEPLDPVAGHIPGAISAPYTDTLEPGGSFKSPEVLRAGFSSLLREIPAERAIFYCGSGVTAAQSVLALAHSGLGQAKLYAGSWSEWITDPGRPIATR
jgi:thiosulfate/3-mercaptopyruvate sulfurtransferase